MKKFWEQLKPQERRVVTIVGVAIFIIANYFLVWPKFGEWGRNRARMQKANDNMAIYRKEIVQKNAIERRIEGYTSAGQTVQAEDQISQFVNFLQDRALENGISIQHSSGLIAHTNDEFFVEQEMNVEVQSNERNLVGFLYSLGASNSMMRARSMSLHAIEPTRYQLDANLKIVASYARKPQNRAPVATAKPAAAPAAAPPPKPAAGPTTAPRSSAPPIINKTTTPTTTNKLGQTKPK